MLKFAKVVGLNSDQTAAQALIVDIGNQDPSEGNTFDNRLHLFIIVKCGCDDAFSKVRQALALAEDAFSASSEPISQRLSNSLSVIKESLVDTNNLQVLIAAVHKEKLSSSVLYLISEGEGMAAYLVRDGKRVSLLDMAEEGNLVSGFLREGDKVWLSTKSLHDILGQSFNSLSTLPVQVLEEEINSRLPQDTVNPLAAIFIEEEKIIKQEETAFDTSDKIPTLSTFSDQDQEDNAPRTYFPQRVISKLGSVLEKTISRPGKDIYVYQPHYQKELKIIPKKAFLLAGTVLIIGVVAAVIVLKPKIWQSSPLENNQQEVLSDQKEVDPNIVEVSDFSLWLDLELIRSGLSAQKLSSSLGNLLILDSEKEVLVKISIDSKSHQILAGEEKFGDGVLSAINGGIAFVFSQDKGIVRIDSDQLKTENVISKDDQWSDIIDIYGFASNIYLLDKGNNEIWKYIPIESGYTERRSYFAEGVEADFSKAKRMQIDGSIWVLSEDGQIVKFTQGNKDFFTFSQFDGSLNNPASFYVSDETEYIYILDSGNDRLVVFTKDGEYKQQYRSDKFSDFKDLIVDEENKKVYLLDGSKIYQMDLK